MHTYTKIYIASKSWIKGIWGTESTTKQPVYCHCAASTVVVDYSGASKSLYDAIFSYTVFLFKW